MSLVRRAASAVISHWLLKAIGIPALIAAFFVAYFYLLHHPVFPVSVMPLTALDRLIPLEPRALPLYLSIWVYVSLPPALLTTRRALGAYAVDIGLTCFVGLLVFYFWPSAVPTSSVDWTLSPALGQLKAVDAAGNACPSLHVATAAFSCCWLAHLLRRLQAPRWVLLLNALWFIGIAWSTLATRQHVLIDVLAGLALGLAAAMLSLRWRTESRNECKPAFAKMPH